jgi:hypothetical protein
MLTSPYYPLRTGSQWTYRSGNQQVVLRVTKPDKVNDVVCFVLETKRTDGLPITEHLGVQKDGIYRYKAMAFPLTPPVCVLKLPPTKGATWELNSRMGAEPIVGKSALDEVEVTVPAGKFAAKAVTTELQRGEQKFTITTYFARGVGMVKQVQNLAGKEFVLELEKFEEMK